MATVSWVAELDKKEHKNWVMVGCALNITKNGITQLIQGKMEAWYQSLISSPLLQSLPPCICVGHSSKCATCTTWKKELKRLHNSTRPNICWDNSDRQQWGSPTGAWEIAKTFMPTLGTRKGDITDANTTDIGGLLNMLEWCPFIHPQISRAVLSSVRDKCRNLWAHAPKQELQDADVKTIFSHLDSLLKDPVFNGNKAAQMCSKDLHDLYQNSLVSIRESEVEALHLLRQLLVDDVSEMKEQSDLNREEIVRLREQMNIAVKYFNSLIRERDDLREAFCVISEELDDVQRSVQNVVEKLDATKSQVADLKMNLTSMNCEVNGIVSEATANTSKISVLQVDGLKVKEDLEMVKEKPSQGQNDNDFDIPVLCTAPSRLTAFTGRESALAWLENSLVLNKSPGNVETTSCSTKTICGLGGCGKSSLALEFAWRWKSHFTGGIFWVNGESDETLSKSVVENLVLLNVCASKSQNVDDILNRFLVQMSKKKNPWLLVVDNADELRNPTCPSGVKKICEGPWKRNANASKHGNILFTTRQNARDTRTFLKLLPDDCLELRCFSEEEGALFLMQRTGCEGESLDQEAINLTKELGGLPLALEQAAAYKCALPIPCSFKAYLEKYRAVKLDLLKQQPSTALTVEAQHRLSVHTTWTINFEYVIATSPAAAAMMHIASFLESDDIPIAVINPGCPELNEEELRDSTHSEIDVAVILKLMSSYSLFSVNQQAKTFSVHKLVQEVVRESLTLSARIQAMVAATRVLHFAFKANYKGKRNILVALLLNFCQLKNHMEEEMEMSTEDSLCTLFNTETATLCETVSDVCQVDNIAFFRLRAEVSGFHLRVVRMVYNDADQPDLLLSAMVRASISKRDENRNEAKMLSENAVKKVTEMENGGVVISADVKCDVFQHRASFYALEKQWKENFKALLELETLPVSDARFVELQLGIARAESFSSACNFQSALKRYENALSVARKIYYRHHPKLFCVLQHITGLLYSAGKLQEAKMYAEEMLAVWPNHSPLSSIYIVGVASALAVLSEFDPCNSEKKLLRILKDSWPHLHRAVTKDELDSSNQPILNDGAESLAARVLHGIMECFLVIRRKHEVSMIKLNFYQRTAEMLVSIQKDFYGEIHPAMEKAYELLGTVHIHLGNMKEAKRLHELVVKCQQQVSSDHIYQLPPVDENVLQARYFRDTATYFYSQGDYYEARMFYTLALGVSPNDAKLLTNKVAVNVKLLNECATKADKERLLEEALEYSQKSITSDPTWVKGYYWKAVCLARLGKRGPSLATAAVAQHLFPVKCAKIPAVVDCFGSYDTQVVNTVQELQDLQAATGRTNYQNPVFVVKAGKYELSDPLTLPSNSVMVGLGDVQISCSKGVPLKLDKTIYMENITLSPTMESVEELKKRPKDVLFMAK